MHWRIRPRTTSGGGAVVQHLQPYNSSRANLPSFRYDCSTSTMTKYECGYLRVENWPIKPITATNMALVHHSLRRKFEGTAT